MPTRLHIAYGTTFDVSESYDQVHSVLSDYEKRAEFTMDGKKVFIRRGSVLAYEEV